MVERGVWEVLNVTSQTLRVMISCIGESGQVVLAQYFDLIVIYRSL